MQQTLHIFLKDVRRLRYHLLATLGLLVVFAFLANSKALDEGYTQQNRSIRMLYSQVQMFLPVAWAYLIACAIHNEALPGDRQFWLTRPYSRLCLIGAKGLFVIAFICLPMLVTAVITLARGGFPVFANTGNLLWSQVMLSCTAVLPFFALASVTRNLSQFIISAIGLIVGFVTLSQATSHMARPVNWGALEWIRIATFLAVVLAAAAVLLPLQFFTRRTNRARAVLAIGVVGAILASAFPWDTAFAIQTSYTRAVAQDEVRLTFDPARGRYVPPNPEGLFGGPIQIAIPVRLEHAAQSALEAQHVEAHLRSGGALLNPSGEWNGAQLRYIQTESQYRLMLRLDWKSYERFKSTPSDIGVTGYFNVFGGRTSHRTPLSGQETEIPGVGICRALESVSSRNAVARMACRMPFHYPQRAMLRLEHPGTGTMTGEHRMGNGPIGAVPHLSVMHPLEFEQFEFSRASDAGPVFLPAMIREAVLVADSWKLEGHIRKDLTVSGIKLEDYEILPK